MKAVLMRVQRASVTIDERETRSIGRGFLILLAVTHDDTEAQAVKLADKLCSLRLFELPDKTALQPWISFKYFPVFF